MDVISSIRTLLQLTDTVLSFCNDTKELRDVYRDTITTLLILKSICEKLSKKNTRLPKEIYLCFLDVSNEIQRFETYLKTGMRSNVFQRVWRVFRNEGKDLTDRIQFLTTNLKLLIDLKHVNDEDARFDVSQVLLSGSDISSVDENNACLFWEKHFGSETGSIPFSRCIQAFENEFKFNARSAQRAVLQDILDPDCDGNVTVYEFAKWLQRFGPLHSALQTTFDSILDTTKGDLFDFFFGDIFHEQAIACLQSAGPNNVLIRYSDAHDKCFSISLTDSESCVFHLTLLRFGNRFVLLSPAMTPDKWIQKWIKKKNKHLEKRSGKKYVATEKPFEQQQQLQAVVPPSLSSSERSDSLYSIHDDDTFLVTSPQNSKQPTITTDIFFPVPSRQESQQLLLPQKNIRQQSQQQLLARPPAQQPQQQSSLLKRRQQQQPQSELLLSVPSSSSKIDERWPQQSEPDRDYSATIYQTLQILCINRKKGSSSAEPRYNNLMELVQDIRHVMRVRQSDMTASFANRELSPISLDRIRKNKRRSSPW